MLVVSKYFLTHLEIGYLFALVTVNRVLKIEKRYRDFDEIVRSKKSSTKLLY